MLVVLLTLGALGVSTITWFGQKILRDALRDALRRVYRAQVRLIELENTVQKDLQAIRGMVQLQSGGIVFKPSVRIVEAIVLDSRIAASPKKIPSNRQR